MYAFIVLSRCQRRTVLQAYLIVTVGVLLDAVQSGLLPRSQYIYNRIFMRSSSISVTGTFINRKLMSKITKDYFTIFNLRGRHNLVPVTVAFI